MALKESDAAWVRGIAPEGIVTLGDPILRRTCSPVADFSAARLLADGMIERLRLLGGAGLAAPQVGHSLQLAIVEVRKTALFPDRPESPLLVLVNPEVEPRSPDKELGWEGCFSIPGLMGVVPRYSAVSVSYQDLAGNPREEVFEGYLARVIQHECDHLEGVLFLDWMEDASSLTTVENYKKFFHGKPLENLEDS